MAEPQANQLEQETCDILGHGGISRECRHHYTTGKRKRAWCVVEGDHSPRCNLDKHDGDRNGDKPVDVVVKLGVPA